MADTQTIDVRKAELFARRTANQVAAAMNCSLSHVGDQLDLYKTIRDFGPVTSDVLAAKTGLHERWLREWLRHQACNEQLEYDPAKDEFSISPEAALVLVEKDSPLYFAGGFAAFEAARTAIERLPDSFHTGLGMSYEDHGPACACGIERMNGFVTKYELVQAVLPEVEGLSDALNSGIDVADVGCGTAGALIAMAAAFPNSSFVGYEVSTHALARARANVDSSELSNIRLEDAREAPLPASPSFDFITTFDVVHDTPFPDRLIADIFAALKPTGSWLCSDIRSFPTFAENLEDNPHAALMYGFSLMVCMNSAMSEEGGAGLGTLGFNEDVAREMTSSAGFSRFRKLDYETAVNSYYDIRP